MKSKNFILIFTALTLIQCGDKIKFVNKEVLIKGTKNKITISVPESCSKFSQGVNISLEALVKYAEREPSLKTSFDMVNVISEFSERINTITAAQCKIIQTSVVIDPDISDQVFYNELIKNYVDYQKIRDISSQTNLSDHDKNLISKAISDVYKSIYTTKFNELPQYVKDMKLNLKGGDGGIFTVYVNENLVCVTKVDIRGEANCVVDKKFLIPYPGEENKIKIAYEIPHSNSIGKVKEYSLGELLLINKTGKVAL